MTNQAISTSTTTISKKAPRTKYNYPFQSKAQILAAQTDFAVCVSHLLSLYAAQTADEQAEENTKFKNRRGFMSSHAVTGSKLAVKIKSGEELSDEDVSKVRSIVCRYGKQLAAFSREEAMAANPELRAIADIFSAG